VYIDQTERECIGHPRKRARRLTKMTNHFGKIAAGLYFAFAVGLIGLIGNLI
jgi:hypothetical protein